ncbi:thioredoxin family protein [Saccharopolyspora endophytica]|uniref:Thioredoxin family protein n=1 Tax=Saccharopolyspora endophytica TaxID=543886 RepID=A0ABS5DK34_9PSEU|nr:thioredoxin family protein [Saccharopolyspora endophytica]MBQ0926644.1 thioredoxin family protein [Saccharopolyspora endophytica]
MRITVLTIPGCPNASLAQQRITSALAGRAADVDLVEVHDQAQAIERGMTGSPTVLLNGSDPFAQPQTAPSLSCRLYRNADGTVDGAPSETALRQAIDEALG